MISIGARLRAPAIQQRACGDAALSFLVRRRRGVRHLDDRLHRGRNRAAGERGEVADVERLQLCVVG
jgi:hypothetical protein